MSQVAEIIGAIADLVEAINGLIQTDTFKELVNVVKQLGLEKTVGPILGKLCEVLTQVIKWLGTLERIAALPRITEPLMLNFADIKVMTDMSVPGKKEEMAELGWGELVPVAEAANVAASLFTRLGNVASALTGGDQLEKKIELLGKRMQELFTTFDDYRKKLAAPAATTTGSSTAAASTTAGALTSGAPALAGAVA